MVSLGLLGLLENECLVDVGDDTTSSDGRLDESIELLVSSDGQLKMSGRDSLHLEVLACIPGQLQHLGSKILEDCSRVDCRRGSDSAVSLNAALQESVNSPDGELEQNG